jgi:hypothetical protein
MFKVPDELASDLSKEMSYLTLAVLNIGLDDEQGFLCLCLSSDGPDGQNAYSRHGPNTFSRIAVPPARLKLGYDVDLSPTSVFLHHFIDKNPASSFDESPMGLHFYWRSETYRISGFEADPIQNRYRGFTKDSWIGLRGTGAEMALSLLALPCNDAGPALSIVILFSRGPRGARCSVHAREMLDHDWRTSLIDELQNAREATIKSDRANVIFNGKEGIVAIGLRRMPSVSESSQIQMHARMNWPVDAFQYQLTVSLKD